MLVGQPWSAKSPLATSKYQKTWPLHGCVVIQHTHVAKVFLKPFAAFHGNTVACTWCHGNPVPLGLLERGLCLLEQAKQPTKEP